FPRIYWDEMRCWATFAAAEPDEKANTAARHVIVFLRYCDGFVVANIAGRGWCTPSGRLEEGESPIDTAIRETPEQTDSQLLGARLLGHYLLEYDGGSTACIPAFSGRTDGPGQIPSGSESLGARVIRVSDLSAVYYRWDALLEALFDLAFKVTSGAEVSFQPK